MWLMDSQRKICLKIFWAVQVNFKNSVPILQRLLYMLNCSLSVLYVDLNV